MKVWSVDVKGRLLIATKGEPPDIELISETLNALTRCYIDPRGDLTVWAETTPVDAEVSVTEVAVTPKETEGQ